MFWIHTGLQLYRWKERESVSKIVDSEWLQHVEQRDSLDSHHHKTPHESHTGTCNSVFPSIPQKPPASSTPLISASYCIPCCHLKLFLKALKHMLRLWNRPNCSCVLWFRQICISCYAFAHTVLFGRTGFSGTSQYVCRVSETTLNVTLGPNADQNMPSWESNMFLQVLAML